VRGWRTIRAASGGHYFAAAAAGLTIVLSVPVALGADAPSRTEMLRAQESQLESAARAATLELYALETQLARARNAASTLAERRHELAGRQAATRKRLAIAARAASVSQRRLEELLRELYAHEADDPLAIVLAAGSLDEALAGLESLDRAAAEHVRVLERAAATRARLDRLNEELTARAGQLAAISARAEAEARALELRVAERAAYSADLRRRGVLTRRELAAAEAQGKTAGRRSAALQDRAAAPAAPSEPAEPAPDEQRSTEVAVPVQVPAVGAASRLQVVAVGYSLPGFTASGLPVGHGIAAVDPSVIPLGTRMHVPGYGVAVAADTGGAVRGALIDLWFPTPAEARAWGRRSVVITLR